MAGESFPQAKHVVSKDNLELLTFWWNFMHNLGGGDTEKGVRVLFYEQGHEGFFDEVKSSATDAALHTVRLFPKGCINKDWNRIGRTTELLSVLAFHIVRYVIEPVNADAKEVAVAAATTHVSVSYMEHGLQTYQLSHSIAASFALTAVPTALLEELRAPFPAFCVTLPKDFLELENNTYVQDVVIGEVPAKQGHTLVLSLGLTDNDWAAVAEANTLRELLLKLTTIELRGVGRVRAARVLLAVRRIVVGTCLYATNGGALKQVSGPGRNVNGESQKRGPPQRRIYRLTHPVKDNLTKVVHSYIRGESRKMNIQTIVAGHWKMQPHGPHNTLRRRQFIEPYWKGPEDAPIALRPHKVG